MHNRFTYILLGLFATLFVACGSIYDNGECVSAEHKISFVVSVNNSGTRTTWGDDYTSTIGSSFDNMIRLDALRVAIIDAATNTHIGNVENLIHWSESENTYRFVGEVTKLNLTPGTEYKVAVYANCTNAEDSAMWFDYTALDPQSGAIPMWGVKQVALALTDNQDIGTISMLRAAAKVEVNLGPAMADYTIHSVTMNVLNRYGYSLPNGWNGVANTTEIVRDNTMREYRSLYTPTGGVVFEAMSERQHILYIPEYSNVDPLTPVAKMTVVLVDENGVHQTFKDALSFGTYTAGKLVEGTTYDIVRNNYYQFNITGVSGGLTIDYKVADWSEGGSWDYGEFAYPTYHNPILPDDVYNLGNVSSDPVITTNPVMSYNAVDDEAGAFSAWFLMTAPVGQQWTPSLINQSEADYEIRVYKGGVLITDVEQMVASSDWYNIKIVPLKPERIGTVVKFGISHKASWMHEGTRLYLLINGKADAIAWPNSGSDPKIIEITQQ